MPIDIYSDEGLSGTSSKRREEFNRMIKDAISGKFDLIITKSISRFARNTVDTLLAIRKLKEAGVEVFFEKEQIYSFDSKGEFMLTLLSSIAQEESRSISENVTWGHRKRFADGIYSFPYARFLGYKKGIDGKPEIIREEAEIIRLIYRLYLEGRTPSNIAALLEDADIISPGGKSRWQVQTVINILTNEKYYGAAMLQKTFTVDFLSKKKKKNNGELPRYFIEDDHEPIISKTVFDEVQSRMGRMVNDNFSQYPLSNKIICESCGGTFGRKITGSYSDFKKYRKAVWRCNRKYDGLEKCKTPPLNEEAAFYAFNKAVIDIWNAQPDMAILCRKTLTSLIYSNKGSRDKSKRLRSIDDFLANFCYRPPESIVFDDSAWRVIVEKAIVALDKRLRLKLINGEEYAYSILRPHEFRKMKNPPASKSGDSIRL